MKHTFLLIGEEQGEWSRSLEKALSPLGKLWIAPETALENSIVRRHYDIAIIDSGHVPDVSKLISRLRMQQSDMHIVVATLSPTWVRAKEALRSGATNYIRKSMDEKAIREEFRELLATPFPLRQSEKNQTPSKPKGSNKTKATILIADNDVDFSETRAEFLEREGYKVLLVVNPTDAKRLLEKGGIDLAILDIRMTNDDDEKDTSGLTLARTVAPSIPKIMLTGYPTVDNLRGSMGYITTAGMPAAINFLSKKDGTIAMITAISDTIEKFVEREKSPKDSNPSTSDNASRPQVSPKNKSLPALILYFIFVTFPKALGRFILDMFGSDKATDITAIILGYIVILVVVSIIKGVINPDNALNTFKDTWRFFFPPK